MSEIEELRAEVNRLRERLTLIEQRYSMDRAPFQDTYPYNVPQNLWTKEEAAIVAAHQQAQLDQENGRGNIYRPQPQTDQQTGCG